MKVFPKNFLDIVLFVMLFIVIIFPFTLRKNIEESDKTEKISIGVYNPFEGIDIQAKSAYVWDIKNQKAIFSLNASSTLPLASITKLMTAIVVLENSPKDYQFTFDSESLKEEGDNGLLVGEKWKIKDMVDFMLVMSSNDGARSLATAIEAIKTEKTFHELMNIKAQELGLGSLYFNNPTGLDIDELQAGGYGNAHEIAKLYEYALIKYPEILEPTTKEAISVESDYFKHTAINTNSAIRSINGVIGSKTGYSDLAGGNLGIVSDIGIQRPVVIVVLNSSNTERFNDVKKLLEASRQYIALEK